MDKALELYEDIYGQWRTYYELWRFNFIDEKMKDAQKFSGKLIRLKPEYPQSYIAYLASHEKGIDKVNEKQTQPIVTKFFTSHDKKFSFMDT